MHRTFFYLLVLVFWFVADFFTKIWAMQTLSKGSIYVNEYFNLVLAFNRGAAFSFLADAAGWQRWMFLAITLVVCSWLLWQIICDRGTFVEMFAYASIVGGALGNGYDRLTHGYVVDFIQWHYKDWYWPVFNIADTAVCIGIGLLLLEWLFTEKGIRSSIRRE